MSSRAAVATAIWLAAAALVRYAPAHAADSDATSPPNNAAAAQELPQVTVIGNAPLPGLGLPLNQVPSNVQTADSADLKRAQSTDVADYLNRKFSGVNVSESADNPFQLDINYHGFTASPLLGTPEGVSVYVDGVRVNESFGDTVNWDLIPESAVSTVSLISGSNPVFGLNTLGGALSLQTKSGHDNPGTQFEAYGGSFGRRAFEGGNRRRARRIRLLRDRQLLRRDRLARHVLVTVVAGVRQSRLADREDRSRSQLHLRRHQPVRQRGAPQSMLAYRREQSYTPDFTHNVLHFVNLTGTQFLSEHLLLSGNAYYRHLMTGSSNVSNNDNYLSENYPGPPIDCDATPSDRAALTYCAQAATQLSGLRQRTAGLGLQLTDAADLFGHKNQGIVGVDYSDSHDTFDQAFQYGAFAPDRTLVFQPSPFNNETVISLRGTNRILGAYLTDTWSPSELLHVTVSARYNRNTETLDGYSIDTDVGDLGSDFDAASPLTGDHTFSRLNPAIGFTVTPSDTLTYYANYNEASRAPTVIELGCANPAQPCGLPNDFASDPPLKQVVARTFEVGARGNFSGQWLHWSADLFRTVNRDDIQFIATTTNSGYFDNVGTTRREGLDLALGGQAGGLRWNLSYSLVDATFQSAFEVSAESNSSADGDGNILVRPGDRLPLVPRHTGKLALDYQLTPALDLGGTFTVTSGSYLHGNENNANQAGTTNAAGDFIAGSGWIGGYALLNIQGTYRFTPHFEVFARLVNLLDRQYATAGFLTTSTFTASGVFLTHPDDWANENAVSPGAPFGIWAGVRVHLD